MNKPLDDGKVKPDIFIGAKNEMKQTLKTFFYE